MLLFAPRAGGFGGGGGGPGINKAGPVYLIQHIKVSSLGYDLNLLSGMQKRVQKLVCAQVTPRMVVSGGAPSPTQAS